MDVLLREKAKVVRQAVRSPRQRMLPRMLIELSRTSSLPMLNNQMNRRLEDALEGTARKADAAKTPIVQSGGMSDTNCHTKRLAFEPCKKSPGNPE